MAFLKNIGTYFGRRKAKVFSLFLLASLLAWLISNLSEVYEAPVFFKVHYENVPDTLLVGKEAKKGVRAKIRTSGFRLMSYNLGPKQISINVSKARKARHRFYLNPNELSQTLESQLSTSVQVLQTDRDTLFLDVYQVAKKQVPVQLDVNLKLAQNHILEGGLKVVPNKVTIKGPKNEIDSIKRIKTVRFNLRDITSDISERVQLVRPGAMKNSELLSATVTVTGKVKRFSEKEFNIAVTAVNIPDGYVAKTFPNTAPILCKAPVDRLKTIESQDFLLVADYNNVQDDNSVLLRIEKIPDGVYDTRLLENQTTLILEEK